MNFTESDKLLIATIVEHKFQSNDSFLSYLTDSVPFGVFSIDDIKNLIGPTSTVQSLNATSDFSNLIHQIPRSSIFNYDNSLLWERYNLLLTEVVLAKNNDIGKKVHTEMTEEQQIKYSRYKEIREELFIALTDYSKSTLTNNPDDLLKTTMKEKIDILQRKWVEEGFKNEIEAYIDSKVIDNTLTFSSLWALWRGKFSEFLSISSDLKGADSQFATFYVPFKNMQNDAQWQRLDFTHDSIQTIIPVIPFKNRRDEIIQYTKQIENIGFEFIKLSVERSWFISQIFEAKFWKISSNFEDEIVSDGNLSGTISSYIQEVIFIKHFTKKERKGLILAGLEWIGELAYDKIYKKEPLDEMFYLVAMGCKIVPKCPNPDPNLFWS